MFLEGLACRVHHINQSDQRPIRIYLKLLMFNKVITALNNSPIVSTLNMVPTTAIRRMVPRWSKNNLRKIKQINKQPPRYLNNHTDLFGMKYPASRMIGGSMKRKKTSGVRVEGGCSEVRNRRNPMMIPTTMRRQDSGKI